MNIALSTAMKAKKDVLYVDTGGSMSGTRIREMLHGWNSSLEDQVCKVEYSKEFGQKPSRLKKKTKIHSILFSSWCNSQGIAFII